MLLQLEVEDAFLELLHIEQLVGLLILFAFFVSSWSRLRSLWWLFLASQVSLGLGLFEFVMAHLSLVEVVLLGCLVILEVSSTPL